MSRSRIAAEIATTATAALAEAGGMHPAVHNRARAAVSLCATHGPVRQWCVTESCPDAARVGAFLQGFEGCVSG